MHLLLFLFPEFRVINMFIIIMVMVLHKGL